MRERKHNIRCAKKREGAARERRAAISGGIKKSALHETRGFSGARGGELQIYAPPVRHVARSMHHETSAASERRERRSGAISYSSDTTEKRSPSASKFRPIRIFTRAVLARSVPLI